MKTKIIILLVAPVLFGCHQQNEKRMYELAAMDCILGNVVYDKDPETGRYGPVYLFGCPNGDKEIVRRGSK